MTGHYPRTLPRLLSLSLLAITATASLTPAQTPLPQPPDPKTTLRTTVRRVVVDVVVSDKQGHPVPGLTRNDFALTEDEQPQKILTFEANGFGQAMDYVPPKLPPQPADTFLNLPTTPERGPLYVLFYDLVNMDNEDQMAGTANQHSDQIRGREQLRRFIQSKPEGARFALLVWSDGLHLLQGFTSDRDKLYTVLNPDVARPHLPRVFLMGENQGRGDPNATLGILQQIAAFLDGLPGRKNLIWFSGGFPLALFPGKDDGPKHVEEIKSTLNLLAQNQVAIYPVDVRGVVYANAHSTDGPPEDRLEETAKAAAGTQGGSATTKAGAPLGEPSAGPHGENAQQGNSLIRGSYFTEDEVARVTGGRAFYSNNDVTAELGAATDAGSGYYTLTYAPTDRSDNGNLRHIHVTLNGTDAHLDYRRAYFATPPSLQGGGQFKSVSLSNTGANQPGDARRPIDDSLSVNMRHGAPMMHSLLFAVQVHPTGNPERGTPEEMAHLATEPAFLPSSGKPSTKSLAPIPLQRYSISFRIFGSQFHGTQALVDLEVAVAAYDADGQLLNEKVNTASRPAAAAPVASADAAAAHPLRLDQELAVPLRAAFLRFAVRDANTGRIGATELTLPLPANAPTPTANATPAATTNPASTP